MPRTTLTRSTYALQPNPPGVLRAGAATEDITPIPGVPGAGYGIWGTDLIDRMHRLYARALVIEQATGGRVALVGIDMHSASRYLCERVANQTAGIGLSVDRILLGPSHTHRGPAGYFADRFYDKNAGNQKGFFKEIADELATRIAEAIKAAVGELKPAVVGHADVPLYGFCQNRSFGGFRTNGERPRDFSQRVSGVAGPAIGGRRLAIDPRVRVTAAFQASSRFPIGVFAALPVHNTVLAPMRTELSPDWMGWASMTAADLIQDDASLWTHFATSATLPETMRGRVGVSTVSGPQGDTNAWQSGNPDDFHQSRLDGTQLRNVGEAYGQAIHQAVQAARASATDTVTLTVRFEEVNAPNNGLEPDGKVGMVTLAGSDGARSTYERPDEQDRVDSENKALRDGSKLVGTLYPEPSAAIWPVPGRPHYPKIRMPDDFVGWFPPVANLLSNLQGELNRVFVHRILSVGDRHWFTIPGEVTVYLGNVIEQTVAAQLGGSAALVGLTGDYIAYMTTAAEYDEQHYEASSTVYGADTGTWLNGRFQSLAAGPGTSPPSGDVRFRHLAKETIAPLFGNHVPPSATMRTNGRVLRGTWQADPSVVPPGNEGPWIALEWLSAGAWQPVLWKNAPVDDQVRPFVIRRDYGVHFTTWRWYYAVPAGLAAQLDGQQVRAVLRPAAWTTPPSGGWPQVLFQDDGIDKNPMPKDRDP